MPPFFLESPNRLFFIQGALWLSSFAYHGYLHLILQLVLRFIESHWRFLYAFFGFTPRSSYVQKDCRFGVWYPIFSITLFPSSNLAAYQCLFNRIGFRAYSPSCQQLHRFQSLHRVNGAAILLLVTKMQRTSLLIQLLASGFARLLAMRLVQLVCKEPRVSGLYSWMTLGEWG